MNPFSIRSFFALFVLIVLLISPAVAAPPQVGGTLPEFKLQAPAASAERDYLGLSGGGAFKVTDIKAEIVLVEIFSMYCPFCQKDAPNMNRFYETIEASPALRGKIKVIGIGAGNSVYEVGVFKQKYAVPFPLFPDADFSIHKLLGEVRTPYFIAVRIDGSKGNRVIYSKLGSFGDVNAFIETLMKAAGLK